MKAINDFFEIFRTLSGKYPLSLVIKCNKRGSGTEYTMHILAQKYSLHILSSGDADIVYIRDEDMERLFVRAKDALINAESRLETLREEYERRTNNEKQLN